MKNRNTQYNIQSSHSNFLINMISKSFEFKITTTTKAKYKHNYSNIFSLSLFTITVVILSQIIQANTKNTYFQLLSSKDKYTQVSFQKANISKANSTCENSTISESDLNSPETASIINEISKEVDSISNSNENENMGYFIKNFNNGTTSFFENKKSEILLEFNNYKKTSDISFKKPVTFNTETLELLLENNADLSFENINQFYLYTLEDFQSQIKGWSLDATSVCGKNDNLFLGGPCKFANTTVSKEFTDLPNHSEIRITANFHFFDDWNGDEAYMLIDEQPMWSDNYSWCSGSIIWMCEQKSISACGSEKADRLSVPIDVTFNHSKSSFILKFLAFIDKTPCEASWGIDDVSIYLR